MEHSLHKQPKKNPQRLGKVAISPADLGLSPPRQTPSQLGAYLLGHDVGVRPWPLHCCPEDGMRTSQKP